MDNPDTDTKNPVTGVDSGACEQSTFSGADIHDYTQEPDKWQVKDNQRLCTDLTDFLVFYRDRYGLHGFLVKAINLVKRLSERLAFDKGEDHD